jgi:ubiquinone/menaquinone biosynthesis C-methylase UbiE
VRIKVKEKLANLAKTSPSLYKLLSKVYYALEYKHLLELFSGTRVREKWWARRKIAEGYWENRNHPSKRYLADKIGEFMPARNVLEVGCASGPNLYVLAKSYPETDFVGIDVNFPAIKYGNEQFVKEGISNVKLLVGKADELEQFREKSFDIVFTNALLIYIGPDRIEKVVREFIRVCQHAIILMELQFFDPRKKNSGGLGVYQSGNWVRDYRELFKKYVGEKNITIAKIPEKVWPVSPWKEMGAVIEVRLQ